ncbi:hypothetical protein KIN20_009893 [Parelaphostrongylus tenuis]|uniref:Uncharacterized protein n=1 Tax=Parelaphostrongylus tenuis TaxID=148309 RepID=A0AAD5MYC2_PARTN|nr:hypothetical protein KIN20_009893 [Parelaphostrongylus tenuis]
MVLMATAHQRQISAKFDMLRRLIGKQSERTQHTHQTADRKHVLGEGDANELASNSWDTIRNGDKMIDSSTESWAKARRFCIM